MKWGFVFRYVGILVFFLGLTMLLPAGVGLFYGDSSLRPLAWSAAAAILCGGAPLAVFGREKKDYISQREAMAIVAISWTAIGFFGAL
ncbi:MAG: TrkH family potassium uptake protein, partial [Thermodesulfobacteriota bacterium]